MKNNDKLKILVLLLLAGLIVACGEKNGPAKIEYRVVTSADNDGMGEDELWVTKNGELMPTNIDEDGFLILNDQRDYDGDGLEEAFLFHHYGGSGYAPPFIVYYDEEAEAFKTVEFQDLSVFLNESVEEWNGKWSFYGGNDAHYERFIFEKGRILKVEDYTKPMPDGAEELLVIDPNTTFTPEEKEASYEREVKKQVSYDLNCDGKNEIIECIYQPGVNWGDPEVNYKPMLEIYIKWSNGGTVQLDSDDDHWLAFKVLSTKTNGVYDLASGIRGVTYRWNGIRYLK